ncbi:MAG: (5-formylfuran-3-yl)methyl phosphate synthase [Candidatus Thiodiazotropha sp.]
MTRLLASVTNAPELELAIEGGADIIDLKNPHTGAQGALHLGLKRELVRQTAGRRPVSATVGDLAPEPLPLTTAIDQTGECGVDYVKVGFFSEHNLTACLNAIARLTDDLSVVAVLFADRQPPLNRLHAFAAAGFRGVMLDTAGKGGGGLLDHIDLQQLDRFVAEIRDLGMFCGLAGSLRLDDVPLLLPLMPDYLGFRGALCEESRRTAVLSPRRLSGIRDAFAVSSTAQDQVAAGG